MLVAEAPWHTTTLARFTMLRRLTLEVPELKPCQVCFFVCFAGTARAQIHGQGSMKHTDMTRLSQRCLKPLAHAWCVVAPHSFHTQLAGTHRACWLTDLVC